MLISLLVTLLVTLLIPAVDLPIPTDHPTAGFALLNQQRIAQKRTCFLSVGASFTQWLSMEAPGVKPGKAIATIPRGENQMTF